jgi:hypothetical protein
MANRGISSDDFAKLVNEIIATRAHARIVKRGGHFICQNNKCNELAEMIFRPTYNDVLVRFTPPPGTANQRPGESFAYEVGSTGLVARAIIDWIYATNRAAFERVVGLKR